MSTAPSVANIPDETLDRMQYRADPLADDTIVGVLDPWQPVAASATEATFASQWQPQWQKLASVTAVFAQWQDNRSVQSWDPQAQGKGLAPNIVASLGKYTQASRSPPDWIDPAKIARAEQLFMDYGALSVTLLFCASLPECYVLPDLAAVLQTTGQLEDHVDYRIRATGAMVFPVMMKGGLTTDDGGGIAQVFKVRLIHATIRNLILRGSPEAAVPLMGAWRNTAGEGVIPPLTALQSTADMHQVLFAHGWNVKEDGLPCNQEELAYTLLTFSYVYLRGMRKLGLGFSREDEEATLHAWNVAGHYLGIERVLMADTMEDAEKLFANMQARGRADWQRHKGSSTVPDPRPRLGEALVNAMAGVIPWRLLKPFPLLMTQYLCGPETSRDLGLDQRVSLFSRLTFWSLMFKLRVLDSVIRLVFPQFSFSRFITRILGYHLMTRLLMDQTRPLKLPEHLRRNIDTVLDGWSEDGHAPHWLNALEDRITIKGSWRRANQ